MPSKDFKPTTKKAQHLTQEKVSVLFYSYLLVSVWYYTQFSFLQTTSLLPLWVSELTTLLPDVPETICNIKSDFFPNTVVVRMCFQLILISS